MKLSDAKQQAIGKHLFVNGKDWGKIKGFDYSYDYRNSIIADYARVNFLSTNILFNLLQGKRVKMRRYFDGVFPRLGYDVYEIKEEEKICKKQAIGDAIWSPGPSPISSIWQHMSGLTIDEAMEEGEIIYKPIKYKETSNDS